MLAPSSAQKFLSYLAGWLTLTGWQASCASGAFNSGLLIQGLITLCNPGYTPTGWRTTLLAWAILLFAVLINTGATNSLAKFEGLILILHIVGFFAILIPITYLGPQGSSADVFNTWVDGGNWSSQGYAFFIGLVGPVYAFVGGDSAAHVAEEVKDAARIVPRAIFISVALNGALGFGMLIATLFAMGDPATTGQEILGTELGFPFIQLFLNSTNSVAGAAVMASIVLILGISSTVGLLASSSRMFWSFSRDRGLPFWKTISKVNSRTSIPVVAVITTTTISALLSLIGIGSSIAFNDIISITVVGLYSSYLLALVLLFWRRITGAIHDSWSDTLPSEPINTHHGQLVWGPFRLPKMIGAIVNAIAIAYLCIVFIFSFWPPAQPVTAATMNYACLVFGATLLFSVVWYFAYARRTYEGPVIDIEVLEAYSSSPSGKASMLK
ncbi:MAG: hypothetical protein M1820_001670 [Bogoriella megaspora]|nr:MAG: hypothetical protein M1820_001670 [Bogoriella megaspora]